MPQDIEQVSTEVVLSLFPSKLHDLQTECSCPDWSNPCKHIAAVYYLIAEQFDRDPFLLLRLRGLDRDGLLARLRTAASAAEADAEPATPPEPLPADGATFWATAKLPDDFFGAVQPPPVSAALVKRLGAFPFWRGRQALLEELEPTYRQAAQRGLAVFVGETATPVK